MVKYAFPVELLEKHVVPTKFVVQGSAKMEPAWHAVERTNHVVNLVQNVEMDWPATVENVFLVEALEKPAALIAPVLPEYAKMGYVHLVVE